MSHGDAMEYQDELVDERDPQEIEEEESRKQQELEDRIQKLSQVLKRHRDDAVKHRLASGVEGRWAEDQAYYEGDDDNARTLYYKGLATDQPLISKMKSRFRSKVFLNITRPYCEIASAKVIEVLSPVDDRMWSIEPTGLPSLPREPSPMVVAIQQAAQTPEGQVPQPVQETPLEQAVIFAKKAAAGAQLWIDDKLQECDFPGEVRALVDEASRLGTGVLRGPVPTMKRTQRVSKDPNTGADIVEILEEIVPQSNHVSVWNCYPDPACGDNIHDGQFFIEHDLMVEKQVLDLIDQPGYIEEAIRKVIEEGPRGDMVGGMADRPHDSLDLSAARFHVWYYYGYLTREDVIALGCACNPEDEIANVGVPVVVTMINDTPVKAHLNPSPSGRFPYDFMCWQRVAGSPFGIGIARQIRACQAILNSHVRAMMENAGLSSGPQIIIARGSIVPADQNWEVTPRKIWYLKPDADIQNVQNALNAVQIPSIQAELLAAIDFALKMAENVTGLPILLQGQQGPTGVPDTVGGMQILVANASSLLRRMARIFDDYLIKPHIGAYYDYMMLYCEDASVKGDFRVVARGSSALVKRDQRNAFITQVAPTMMANPAYGIDPTRLFKKIATISGMDDADEIQFTKDEMAVIQKSQQDAAMMDPRVLVANITGEVRKTIAEMQDKTNQARVQGQYERDVAYIQSEVARTEKTAEAKFAELQLRRELALLEYANREKISLDSLKTQLAISLSNNDLQRELATLPTVKELAEVSKGDTAPEEAGMPSRAPGLEPIEPPGKAPDHMADYL